MNAKACKKLRRAAGAVTPGKPARKLLGKPVTVHTADGRAYQRLIAVNDPNSARGVSQGLKRGHLRIVT